MNLTEEITKDLLTIKAVQIDPQNYFTWTSGIQSPIYCDNRLTMSHPNVRNKITNAFINMVNQLEVKPDVIAGCATAGIPHAAWLANELNLPMIYVRGSAKAHGKGNQIEGKLEKDQNVLVIEDLISTGGSALNTVDAIKDSEAHVVSVFAIFTYGLNKAAKQFAESQVPFQTITSFDQLIDALLSTKDINESDKNGLLRWRDSL
ncbi:MULTISPECIES: orotate phosphoribosyltransferase [Allobacillus]|uniref:Orotate phosphoribosyltransferase n=1 Tax=Allobacillus salarius TaxID=1955272 RepID=A0A556PA24_9BACI|nr:orotate phosphoribosyltransferase [Allobacillus salarius]TSJ61254.1 orotate phosphoribosyltransferase [Allobacillus salarius]